MTDPQGTLGYAEIPVDDLERAKAFYAAAFGWTYHDVPGYTFFESGEGGQAGGFQPRGERTPPHPVNYVICDDLDAAVERVMAGGGAVVNPRSEFGDLGWLAHVADTEGNVFGLWQAKPGA